MPSKKSRAGRHIYAGKADGRLPASASPIDGDGAGLIMAADKAGALAPASSPLDQLAELQVRRKFCIAATNKQTNSAKALARRAIGWRHDGSEEDREKMNGRAAKIVAAALAGREQKAEDAAVFGALAADLAVIGSAVAPLQNARHQVELEMKRLARKLPVAAWAKDVHGLGELGLAVIVGEAGDLAKYPKKGHLWKRLGLAVHDGRAYSTWRMKGGLTAEQWTEAGYSPRRRAEVHAVVAEPLLRAQSVVSGPYRAIYDRRKAATEADRPDWTKAHRHADAMRVMTKYLVRDLWVAWRRVDDEVPAGAANCLPAANTESRGGPKALPSPKADGRLPTRDILEREASPQMPSDRANGTLPIARPSTTEGIPHARHPHPQRRATNSGGANGQCKPRRGCWRRRQLRRSL